MVQRHHGQRILIAGHGETTDAAAMLFFGLLPGFSTRTGLETGHAALTRWHMHRNRLGQQLWMLASHNDTLHLASTL
jgi:probable phosphoglycerate mutase